MALYTTSDYPVAKYRKYKRPFFGLAGRAALRISVERAVFKG